jgi:anti-sigma B factor antagonist
MMTHEAKPKSEEALLKIYHAGPITVVGFGGRPLNQRVDFSPYRSVLDELVRRSRCRVLAVDLAGVRDVPAGMLGVLISIRKLVERIEIHNPTASARETLISMKTGSFFDIHESVA